MTLSLIDNLRDIEDNASNAKIEEDYAHIRQQIAELDDKKRTIVVYGGRFHPFHSGHASVYNSLVKKFGKDNVYVVTSGKQAPVSSPFTFDDKTKMMQLLGVPKDKIVQVKNPYVPKEITDKVDQENTSIVFAVSEKDAERFSFAPKKDGTPSYMQPYKKGELAPLSEHGYILIVPTLDFQVGGKDVRSASEIRNMYLNADDRERVDLLRDLYGKAPKALKNLFDKKLSVTEQYYKMLASRKLTEDTDAKREWLAKARIMEARIRRDEFRYPR